MIVHFYDIESLNNVFTLANWKPENNNVDLYYILDNPELMQVPDFNTQLNNAVHEANRNFNGTVTLYDLKQPKSVDRLFKEFGLSDANKVNNPNATSSYPACYRPVCDTDENYDEENTPYLMGYNSDNYDLTMLAVYAHEVFSYDRRPPVLMPGQAPPKMDTAKNIRPEIAIHPTARCMREHNDWIFSRFRSNMPDYLRFSHNMSTGTWEDEGWGSERRRIWKNFKYSGRHIDVSKLNEKQQKVALKRLIGMLGGQIKESDKLDEKNPVVNTTEELIDLIAYNISDVINLDLVIFQNKLYQSQFALKRNMLKTYPELVYEQQEYQYAPDIHPTAVRKDRLYADSSSAQLATKSLCPYGHLTDIPVVSFMYPHEDKAKELGIPRRNILEETRQFFYDKFPDPKLRAEFDRIYNYYKSIEGKNFNESKNYLADYSGKPKFVPYTSIDTIPKEDTSLMYYNADGTPTSCFVNFSIGGIHGAECNLELYLYHRKEWESQVSLLEQAKALYPDPVELRKAKKVTIGETEYPWSTFLKSGATMTNAEYKDLSSKEPKLFTEKDGKTSLNSKYTFTSADTCEHEDFTSYYPNLLRMMKAFYNKGLGYDRYAEVFDNKQHYGFLMKKKNENLTPEQSAKYAHLRTIQGHKIDPLHISDYERKYYSDMREGTKLILNSASGAADANFESNIRMNNTIISMRVIGQLLTYRIGQAQAFEGARVISTNTDGLYSVMDVPGYDYSQNRDFNNNILERESKTIGVEIEPETMYLISKDTNNRMEVDADTDVVTKANGGSLACFESPQPTKSLAHPAILDWALTEYLLYMAKDYPKKGYSLYNEFNYEIGMNILKAAAKKPEFKGWKLLRMYQNIVASSVGSITYIFGTKDSDPTEPVIMQHYNRIFLVKDAAPDTMHLHAAVGRVITASVRQKRKRGNEPAQQHDPIAVSVLKANGITDIATELGSEREATIKKISGVDESWNTIVVNDDLMLYTEEQAQALLDRLDYDKYLQLLADSYNENWRNLSPEDEKLKKASHTKKKDTDTTEKPETKNVSAKKPKRSTKKVSQKTSPEPVIADDSNQSNSMPDLSHGIPADFMNLPEESKSTKNPEPKSQTAVDPTDAILQTMLSSVQTDISSAIRGVTDLKLMAGPDRQTGIEALLALLNDAAQKASAI